MKNIIVIVMYIIGTPVLAFAQQNLWQNIPLDFNQIPNVTPVIAAPSGMYYDSSENACYIVGKFGKIGNTNCNVVKWDGYSFTLLPPSPLNVTNCVIKYKGKLYIGGYGYPVNLACWDGQHWTGLDSSSAAILCFSIYHGKLLIGGNFNNIANSGVGSLAAWDGSVWSSVYDADTVLGNSGWTILSVIEYKNNIYIAGNINVDSPVAINEIARFDGTKWKDVGNFQDGDLDDVRKLLVWNDTLYVAGAFSEANGSPGNGIAKWDGSHWHRLNDGVWQTGGPAITDLRVFHNELYACGWFYTVDGINQGIGFHGFAKWDGSRWCTLGTTANNVPFTMGQFRDSLYLMGAFDSLNNQPMKYMAKWIGGDYTDSCSQPVPAGVSEISSDNKLSLLLFPNPAQNILNVKYYNPEINSGNALITVADLLGRFILSKNIKIKQGENLWHLNTAAIPPGIYFLEINNAERKSIAKFVKQ